MKRITQVRKRDGRVVPFDPRRVADAIYRAARSVGGEDRFLAEELAGVVGLYLERTHAGRVPVVADVEDAVERVLVDTGHAKTAKAFILHRDRRRTARERLSVEDDTPGERPRPLVGSDATGTVAPWTKSRIVAALVEEAGLDAPTADEVARAVEGRVLASGLPRVSSSLVRALVDAELFDRGHARPRERQRVVGVPKRDLTRRVEAGLEDRRVGDPASLVEALGEDLLRQWVLEEVVPAASAEAHRLGELHLQDLGAPRCVETTALSLDALLARHLRGEGVSRAAGPRRFLSALSEAVVRHGRVAARAFVLEDLNVHWAPFVDRLDEDALLAEARELLLSPGVTAFPRRGGLLRLEIVLDAEVPARLAGRPVPAPAPPGMTYADVDDAALRTARALLVAAADLRREGAGDRLPDLSLVVPRGGALDPAARALLREALATAAESGEPVILLDDPGLPSRGGRRQRMGPAEMPDPFRHEQGDVSVATHTAVNLVGPALRSGPGRLEGYLDEVDRLATLALHAAGARRDFLTRGADGPDGSLWTLHQGLVPLLDVDSAVHRVEAVGAARAAALLAPSSGGAGREDLERRILSRLHARVHEEADARRLVVAVVERAASEAASRFAEVDAARYESARAWWEEGDLPSYALERPAAEGLAREPAGGRRGSLRTVHRVSADRRPATDDLEAAFAASARDPRVVEHVVDPWPRRTVSLPR